MYTCIYAYIYIEREKKISLGRALVCVCVGMFTHARKARQDQDDKKSAVTSTTYPRKKNEMKVSSTGEKRNTAKPRNPRKRGKKRRKRRRSRREGVEEEKVEEIAPKVVWIAEQHQR